MNFFPLMVLALGLSSLNASAYEFNCTTFAAPGNPGQSGGRSGKLIIWAKGGSTYFVTMVEQGVREVSTFISLNEMARRDGAEMAKPEVFRQLGIDEEMESDMRRKSYAYPNDDRYYAKGFGLDRGEAGRNNWGGKYIYDTDLFANKPGYFLASYDWNATNASRKSPNYSVAFKCAPTGR